MKFLLKRLTSIFTIFTLVTANLFIAVPTTFAAAETISCNAGGSRTLTQGTYTDSDGTEFTSGADLTLNVGTGVDCTFTFNGEMTLASLTIEGGVTLTHGDNTTTQTNTLTVTATGDIDVQTGAIINVNYLGYNGGAVYGSGYGPGAGTGTGGSQGAGGGAHGGDGGVGRDGSSNDDNPGGAAYCDPDDPDTIGSGGGGGSASSTGGAGGGMIKLDSGGTLSVDGTISAAGQNYTAGGYSAGGAGGTVFLKGNTIDGTPDANISVRGGNGASRGGGGGGGCVYVWYNTSNSLSASDFTYTGGTATGTGQEGGAGIVYIQQNAGDEDIYFNGSGTGDVATTTLSEDVSVNNMTITNNADISTSNTLTLFEADPFASSDNSSQLITTGNVVAASMTTIGGVNLYINGSYTNNASLTIEASTIFGIESTASLSTTISSLTNYGTTFVNSGATFTITDITNEAGTFRLEEYDVDTALSLNDLTINGGNVTHADNSTAQTHVLNISAANITIGSSGSINVDELGYDGGAAYSDGYGPGKGLGSGSNLAAGGGAHGGDGGDGESSNTGGAAYCDILDVDTFGSGGGGGSAGGIGGDGGGLIKLNVSDTLTIDGTISADGGNGAGGYSAGGAGGGINITANTILGAPAADLSANGGSAAQTGQPNGGSGGGCIQIVYASSSIDEDDLSVVAGAANAGGEPGDPGSAGLTSFSASNSAPTISTALASIGQVSDGNGYYNLSFSVNDTDGDLVDIKFECGDGDYSLNTEIPISTDNNETAISGTEYQIEDIDTSSGAVDITVGVWTKGGDGNSALDDIDTSTFQCRVTPYDGSSTGTPNTITDLSLDNLDPDPNNDATYSLVSDTDSNGIANIGDTFVLNAGTENTGDTVTWSFNATGITSDAGVVNAGVTTQPITPGALDIPADFAATITVTDDSGNSVNSATVASMPALDNTLPVISDNGTLSISTDANSDGVAAIGDGVTLSGVTLSADDGDTITIDLSALTGDSAVAMGVEDLVVAGSQTGSKTYTITVTDNAGNSATTTSDAIIVQNSALTLDFSSSSASSSEDAGTVNATLELSSASATDTVISYSVSGTATNGTDYSTLSGSATISAGNTTVNIPIIVANERVYETDETVVLSITSVSGATASGTTTYTLTITNDDPASGGGGGGNGGSGSGSSSSGGDSSNDSGSNESESEGESTDSDEDSEKEVIEVPAFLLPPTYDDDEDDDSDDDGPTLERRNIPDEDGYYYEDDSSLYDVFNNDGNNSDDFYGSSDDEDSSDDDNSSNGGSSGGDNSDTSDSDDDGKTDTDEEYLTFTDPDADDDGTETTAGVTGQTTSASGAQRIKSRGNIIITGQTGETENIRCIVESSPTSNFAVKSYSCDEKLLIAENNIYMLEFTPRDGEGDYKIRIENDKGIVNRFEATIDTAYKVDNPTLFNFGGLSEEEFNYVDENRIVVNSEVGINPVTVVDPTGCIGFGQCIVQARWNSLIFSSVILADSSAGRATITPPRDLTPGEHRLLLTTVDTETNEISETLEINFVVNPEIIEEVKSTLVTMSPLQWALFTVLMTGLLGGSGRYLYNLRAKPKTKS